MSATNFTITAKRIVPRPIKRRCRQLVESVQFRLDMRRFKKLSSNEAVPEELLRRIVVGWGNEWSARWEYLAGVLNAVSNSQGAVLECGSGLTTLLAGIRCNQVARAMWSLEHEPHWAKKMRSLLRKNRINAVQVVDAPIKSYGDYSWYDLSGFDLPDGISLVICDGPPGDTPGGRVGLLPQIKNKLADDCQIFLDDAARPGEQNVLRQWLQDFNGKSRMFGIEKPYALVSLN